MAVLALGLAAPMPLAAQVEVPIDQLTSGFPGFGGPQEQPLTVSAEFTAPQAGQPGKLFMTAVVKSGWHIYSITQPAIPGGGPMASKIKIAPSSDYRIGQFRANPPPAQKTEPAFDNHILENHSGRVTWSASLELGPGVDAASLTIAGKLFAQACDAKTCLPPRDYPFTARLGKGMELPPAASPPPATSPGPSSPPPAVPPTVKLSWRPFVSRTALAELLGKEFNPAEIQQNVRAEFSGASLGEILGAMAAGFLGGLLLNIMPCVLPVIGLKILSFIEQAGHDRRKALVLNVWYSLGLLAVFAVLATLAASIGFGWGQLFTFRGFAIVMASVVFVMGLSFLGVWELPIPGFAGRGKASELAAQEGATGAFVKGALTTLLATPCTAPYLGPVFAWAVAQPPLLTYAVLLSAGLGMASPYLLIGAFPEAVRFLPKPGAWMDTFKQIMGFVLLGTVVFLLTALDPPYVIPTVGLLFALWAGCWWIGRVSPLAEGGAAARAWLEATALVVVVGILMFPGTQGILPDGWAFGGLRDVMQDRFERRVEIAAIRLAPSVRSRQSIGPQTTMVDFTADWCVNCKVFEATVLNTPEVAAAVQRNGVATLQADWTHAEEEVTRMLEVLGSKEVPVLAIFPARDPNHPIVFRGACTQQALLAALQKAGPSL
ncbi:MAG: cytochrome c biogenesis protein CcdA [Thermoguttaceae bacterium]